MINFVERGGGGLLIIRSFLRLQNNYFVIKVESIQISGAYNNDSICICGSYNNQQKCCSYVQKLYA